MRPVRPLLPGFTSEVDNVSEQDWYQLLREFDDASIYQTWAYAEVIAGPRNMSHLVLKRDGEVVAIAQARIAKIPIINLGIAYIHWGPIWRRKGQSTDARTLAMAIRVLRNEFVCRRGLTLRVFPLAFRDHLVPTEDLLAEEGFSPLSSPTSKTILMDLTPSLNELRDGMNSHWKRELKVAEKKQLFLLEGTSDEMFEAFIGIYKEMVSRKKFVEPNDIEQFKRIQARLPEPYKMKIMLCRSDEGVSSGLICSVMGNTAIYLFGATSNAGMKSRGSYMLQWSLLERLKRAKIASYDLNGINPEANPGTYKFKSDLAGKNGCELTFEGRFDSHGGHLSRLCVEGGDVLRPHYRFLKRFAQI
jgi:lipid II:glycine glycyltransferase (peptidoglycan interpeptide bridge formation enzyme)